MLFYNDKLDEIEEERRILIRKVFPPMPQSAVPIDFFNPDVPAIWSLRVNNLGEEWFVLGIFNWSDVEKTIEVNLRDIGLDLDSGILISDVWGQCNSEHYTDTLTIEAMSPHSVNLLTLKPMKDRPQLLATDTHFTHGGTEFEEMHWKEDHILYLRWRHDYKARGKLSLYIPESYRGKGIKVTNGCVTSESTLATIHPDPDAPSLTIHFYSVNGEEQANGTN